MTNHEMWNLILDFETAVRARERYQYSEALDPKRDAETKAERLRTGEALLEALRAAREQIETLSTPDIISVDDHTFYEEEGFSGAAEIPNTYRECDWANRTLGQWYVASVVTEWDADGDPVEEETRLYPTEAAARAAIAASQDQRLSSSLSSEPRNG